MDPLSPLPLSPPSLLVFSIDFYSLSPDSRAVSSSSSDTVGALLLPIHPANETLPLPRQSFPSQPPHAAASFSSPLSFSLGEQRAMRDSWRADPLSCPDSASLQRRWILRAAGAAVVVDLASGDATTMMAMSGADDHNDIGIWGRCTWGLTGRGDTWGSDSSNASLRAVASCLRASARFKHSSSRFALEPRFGYMARL